MGTCGGVRQRDLLVSPLFENVMTFILKSIIHACESVYTQKYESLQMNVCLLYKCVCYVNVLRLHVMHIRIYAYEIMTVR